MDVNGFQQFLLIFLAVEFIMKYILVHWSAANDTTVLTEEFVRDKTMLNDPQKEGMIQFGAIVAKAPCDGWKAYLGRVIYVNGELFIFFCCQKNKEFNISL